MTDEEMIKENERLNEEERAKYAETEPDRRGFRFQHANDLVTSFKNVQWLVKNYLEKDSMMMLVAEAGSWKTFIILSLAYCVASGLSWFGNLIKETGTVFYICGEGKAGLARRLRALEITHGIRIKDIPLFISNQAAGFLDKDGAAEVVAAIEELVEQHGDPVLIIVDTLSRNFGCGDENSTKDMSQFIRVLDNELRAKYKSAISICHHVGLGAKDRGRGSGAMRGALDFEYLVTKNPNDTRTMRCTKPKDHAEPLPITFRAEEIELPGWIDEDTGKQLTSLILIRTMDTGQTKAGGVKLSGQKKIAYDILNQLTKDKQQDMDKMDMNRVTIHVEDWRDACYRGGISNGDANSKWRAFDRSRKELINLNVIKTLDDLYWLNDEN